MRVTNSIILRSYDRNLKRISSQKFASEHRIESGRQYDRASQSPLKAAKALTVRKQLSHTGQYKENLDVADKFYTEAEKSMLQISDSLALVRETMIYACNSTKDKATDLNILAQQLETKAKEMVSVFNTNSAERAIFGGESNSLEPFTLQYGENGQAETVLYHGVPVNAYSSVTDFPYSDDVFIDIGIGMVINADHVVDPQSALKVSFNGADVTGCGYERKSEKSSAIDMSKLNRGTNASNSLRITAKDKTVTVKFSGINTDDIRTAINEAFTNEGFAAGDIPMLGDSGQLTMADGSEVYVSQQASINFDQLKEDQIYTFDIYAGSAKQTVTFTAKGTNAATMAELQAQMDKAFLREKIKPSVDESGNLSLKNTKGEVIPGNVYVAKSDEGTFPDVQNEDYYSNNYIQVTLDAAAALRRGDIEYCNACIDRIVTASDNLLVEIADLGNAEEFIEFNTTRYNTRELNLKDRQKTLEATDMKSEITLMKTYEALYNACLQMSSSVIPNSIFNYIS